MSNNDGIRHRHGFGSRKYITNFTSNCVCVSFCLIPDLLVYVLCVCVLRVYAVLCYVEVKLTKESKIMYVMYCNVSMCLCICHV